MRHGEWKLHWVTEGSHCNSDYPDVECPVYAIMQVNAELSSTQPGDGLHTGS